MSKATDVGCEADDRCLWLEEITGEKALAWVRQHNKPTLAELGSHRFEAMRTEALEIYDADTQIPPVGRAGEHLYNFWRDAMHTRGQLAPHHSRGVPQRLTRVGCPHRRELGVGWR
jgi:prolyl oligopeptidase